MRNTFAKALAPWIASHHHRPLGRAVACLTETLSRLPDQGASELPGVHAKTKVSVARADDSDRVKKCSHRAAASSGHLPELA